MSSTSPPAGMNTPTTARSSPSDRPARSRPRPTGRCAAGTPPSSWPVRNETSAPTPIWYCAASDWLIATSPAPCGGPPALNDSGAPSSHEIAMAERSDAGGWLFRSSAVGTTSTKRCIAPCAPATPGTARTASTTLGSIGPRAPSSSNDVDSTARSMSPTTTVGAAMRVGRRIVVAQVHHHDRAHDHQHRSRDAGHERAPRTPTATLLVGRRPRVANSSSVTGVAAPSIVLRSSSPRSDIFRHPQQCAQPCGAALEMVLHRRDPEPADVG